MKQEEVLMPIFIAKTCKGREKYIEYLKLEIDDLVISYDSFIDTGINDRAYQNFQQSLFMAGENATVQLEDDILLCDDFTNKIIEKINERPNEIIQFFSMRKADLEIGSRYETGSKYMMMQCTYLPAGMAKRIYDFSLTFNTIRKEKNSPTDICVAYFMKQNKLKYWVCVPNLVDHIEGVSRINKRRSSKRQSLTFKKNKP